MNNEYQVGDLLIPFYHEHSIGYVSNIELKNETHRYEVTWILKGSGNAVEPNVIKIYPIYLFEEMIKSYNYFSVKKEE